MTDAAMDQDLVLHSKLYEAIEVFESMGAVGGVNLTNAHAGEFAGLSADGATAEARPLDIAARPPTAGGSTAALDLDAGASGASATPGAGVAASHGAAAGVSAAAPLQGGAAAEVSAPSLAGARGASASGTVPLAADAGTIREASLPAAAAGEGDRPAGDAPTGGETGAPGTPGGPSDQPGPATGGPGPATGGPGPGGTPHVPDPDGPQPGGPGTPLPDPGGPQAGDPGTGGGTPTNGDTDLTVDIGLDLPVIGPVLGDIDVILDPIEAIVGDIDIGIIIGGGPGHPGTGTPTGGDTDLTVDIGLDLPVVGPVVGGIDVILDPIEAILGDIDIGIVVGGGSGLPGTGTPTDGDTDLTVDLGVDLPIVGPVLGAIDVNLDPIEAILGDIDIGLDISGGLGLPNLGTGLPGGVQTVVSGVTAPLGGLLGTGAPADGDTDLTVDLGLGLPIVGPVLGAIDINLDPIEALLGDIDIGVGASLDLGQAGTGLLGTAHDTVSSLTDALSGLGGGLLGSGGAPTGGDTDLTLALGGLPLVGPALGTVEVNLDPVEALLGDVDIGLGASLDVGSAGTALFGTVHDAAASLTDALSGLGGGLLGAGGAPTGGDTDLTLALGGLPLVGPALGTVEVNLDPVEALLGDVDIGLGASLDVGSAGTALFGTVHDAAASLTDALSGLGGGFLGSGGAPTGGDTDLTLALGGLPFVGPALGTVEVNLDPVEALLGDVDIGLGASLDLAGTGLLDTVHDAASSLTTPLAGLTGGLLDTLPGGGAPAADPLSGISGLLGSGGAPTAGDTDLTLDLGGVPLAGSTLGTVGVTLDPLEALLGDIDIAIGTGGGIDLTSAGTGLLATVHDLTSAVADPIGGLTGGLFDSLHGLGSGTSDPLGGLLGTVHDVASIAPVGSLAGGLLGAVHDAASATAASAGGTAGGLLGAVHDIASTAAASTGGATSGALATVHEIAATAADPLAGLADSLLGLGSTVAGTPTGAIDASHLLSAATSALAAPPLLAANPVALFQTLDTSLASDLHAATSSLASATTSLAAGAASAASALTSSLVMSDLASHALTPLATTATSSFATLASSSVAASTASLTSSLASVSHLTSALTSKLTGGFHL